MTIKMTALAMVLLAGMPAWADDIGDIGRAAAGTIIASGCKVGVGTVAGGVLGGLLGSQVGGGRGKDVMAGVGGAVGAWLGSDCSPAAAASVPVALTGPAFRFNGITMTPVDGFPGAAFRGVPPIVSTNDLRVAREVTRRLVASAGESARAGDQESAMLKMYWAKRIGLAEMAITSASLRAISSVATGPAQRGIGRATVTMTVPPKTLIVVPAFDQDGNGSRVTAALDAPTQLSAVDWSAGVQVADNGTAVVGEVLRLLGGNPNQARGPQGSRMNGSQGRRAPEVATPTADMLGLPEGQPLRMSDGSYILKTPGNLTIYNDTEQPVALPLDKLDFVPRTPLPSSARQAAGAMMHTLNEEVVRFTFNEYKHSIGGAAFWTRFEAPNRVVDVLRGPMPVGYTDRTGRVTTSPRDGELEYKANAAYRMAADILGATMKAPGVVEFETACRAERFGWFGKLSGEYSGTLKKICFKGAFSGEGSQQVATRTFVIGENGAAVQTMESLMTDKQIVNEMKKALLAGGLVSDSLSLAGLPLGNVESGMQCMGQDTLAQIASVNAAYKSLGSNVMGTSYAAARIAGWEPKPDEWSVERVASCVGAIPAIGVAATGVKKVAALGQNVLETLPDVGRMQKMFEVFETPRSFNSHVKGIQTAEELWPGNPRAARFVKSIYDAMMTGLGMGQVGGGIGALV